MTLTPAQEKIKILIESHGSYEYKQQSTVYNFSSSILNRVGYMSGIPGTPYLSFFLGPGF